MTSFPVNLIIEIGPSVAIRSILRTQRSSILNGGSAPRVPFVTISSLSCSDMVVVLAPDRRSLLRTSYLPLKHLIQQVSRQFCGLERILTAMGVQYLGESLGPHRHPCLHSRCQYATTSVHCAIPTADTQYPTR